MDVSAKNIEILNGKIEKVNKEKIRVDTQLKMYKSQLAEKLKAYAEKYGENLEGSNFETTIKNVESALEKVRTSVQKEYDFKNQVISLIQSGEIAEANKLLGVGTNDAQVVPEVSTETNTNIQDAVNERVSSIESLVESEEDNLVSEEDIKNKITEATEATDSEKDDEMSFGFGFSVEDDGADEEDDLFGDSDFGFNDVDSSENNKQDMVAPKQVENTNVEKADDPFGFGFSTEFEEDSEEDVNDTPVSSNIKVENPYKNVTPVSELEKPSHSNTMSFNVGDLLLDDDDEDEDDVNENSDPFCFGKMLGGKL